MLVDGRLNRAVAGRVVAVDIGGSRAGMEEREGTSLDSRLMVCVRSVESVAERIREGVSAARLLEWLSVSLVMR